MTLYRGDRSSVTPDVAFKEGFTPKGTGNDLLGHTTSNTTPGNFVSTSADKGIAQGFAGKNGYVYEINTSKMERPRTANRQEILTSHFKNQTSDRNACLPYVYCLGNFDDPCFCP